MEIACALYESLVSLVVCIGLFWLRGLLCLPLHVGKVGVHAVEEHRVIRLLVRLHHPQLSLVGSVLVLELGMQLRVAVFVFVREVILVVSILKRLQFLVKHLGVQLAWFDDLRPLLRLVVRDLVESQSQ